MGLNPLAGDLRLALEARPEIWQRLAHSDILITGGTSFVGTWLLETLLYANAECDLKINVTVVTRNPAAFREACRHLAEAVEIVAGDLLTCDLPLRGFRFVIHGSNEGVAERDVAATKRVIEFAERCRAESLLFISSGAVYGDVNVAVSEGHECTPVSEYGRAKRESEKLCESCEIARIARLFTFVGPRLPLDRNYAVGNFIQDVLEGRAVSVEGDGTPYRSYLYAADLAWWLWTILLDGRPGGVYNVGSEEEIQIRELAEMVAAIGGSRKGVRVAQSPDPMAGPKRYVPCVERAKRELGLRQLLGLRAGIERTFDWHRR